MNLRLDTLTPSLTQLNNLITSPSIQALDNGQNSTPLPQYIRILWTYQNLAKTIKIEPFQTVNALKLQIVDKSNTEYPDIQNFGLFLPGTQGKDGKFLDDQRILASYKLDVDTILEFKLKHRVVHADTKQYQSENSKKGQKRFLEYLSKNAFDKMRERAIFGMDPNFQSDTGETPLTMAVAMNNKDLMICLIEMGAILDFRASKDWKTPLHVAAIQNSDIAVKTLLSFGAWVDVRDNQNLTPLYYASTHGHTDVVSALMTAKASMTTTDESGKNPLHQASGNNHVDVVKLLIEHGANIDAVNSVGNTALHIAATRNSKDVALALLQKGASRTLTNQAAQTPAQVAVLCGNIELADLIKKFQNNQSNLSSMVEKDKGRNLTNYHFTTSATKLTQPSSFLSNMSELEDASTKNNRISPKRDSNAATPSALPVQPALLTKSLSFISTSSLSSLTLPPPPPPPPIPISLNSRKSTSSSLDRKLSFQSQLSIPPPPPSPSSPNSPSINNQNITSLPSIGQLSLANVQMMPSPPPPPPPPSPAPSSTTMPLFSHAPSTSSSDLLHAKSLKTNTLRHPRLSNSLMAPSSPPPPPPPPPPILRP